MVQSEATPRVDFHLPDYTLQQKLGQGGMGEVYLAVRKRDGVRVAVKFLNAGERSDEPEIRLRFERETRLLYECSHSNIVAVLDHGSADGRPYLVMEYLSGGSLRRWIGPGQALPVSRVRQVVGGIARALAALEERRILHRDLKPENVLLGEGGEVKVSDFGISAALTEVGQLTETAQALGTIDYMAPEQRYRLSIDSRADQYSLGVIAYELLTGRRPLGNFKPPSRLNPRLHPSVDAAVSKALQEDPDDRYDRIPDFAHALDEALRRRPARFWSRGLVAAVVGLAIGTAIFFVAHRPEQAQVPEPESAPRVAEESAKFAEPVADVAPAPDPKARAKYYFDLGEEHFLAGREKNAESCYTEAIRLDPTDPLPLLKRAFLYKKREIYEKALEDIESALRLDPKCQEALVGKGSIFVQLQDYALALPVLNEAVELNPVSAEALAWRGRALYKLGHDDLARDDLDLSTSLDGNLGIGYLFRSLIHLADQNFLQTRRDLESAIDCMPDNHHAHAKLSDLLAQCPDKSLRDLPRAIDHARKACELTRWQGHEELRFLARAYAANGKLEEAVERTEQALKLAPALSQDKLKEQLANYQRRLSQRKK